MPTSIKVNQKRRGRPATGRDPVTAVRIPDEIGRQIDAWAAKNDVHSRSEAIRRLIELGLATAKVPRAKSFKAKTGRALRNVEQDLDDALGNTFPASDPVEMEEPTVRSGRPGKSARRKLAAKPSSR